MVIGAAVAAASVAYVAYVARNLRPAWIGYNPERIDLAVEDRISGSILWDGDVHVKPFFNHVLGYNHFYGFLVSRRGVSISASPEEGWPLEEITVAMSEILRIAEAKGVAISKDFQVVKGIKPE